MKSQYVFDKRKNYLALVITGEYDKDEFMSYPKLILEEAEKENVNKVLIDILQLKGTNIPLMDRFFIAERISTQIGGKVKLAIAWPKEHINKFAETVAVNRGGLMNVVDTVDAAQEWLLNEN